MEYARYKDPHNLCASVVLFASLRHASVLILISDFLRFAIHAICFVAAVLNFIYAVSCCEVLNLEIFGNRP